jgi:hypothetical protein
VVLHCYQPGDMVWVQDYHLMLLPSILKNAVPRIKVISKTAVNFLCSQPAVFVVCGLCINYPCMLCCACALF